MSFALFSTTNVQFASHAASVRPQFEAAPYGAKPTPWSSVTGGCERQPGPERRANEQTLAKHQSPKLGHWRVASSEFPSSDARPLRLINTKTHRLVDFPEHRDEYPSYAILSHRWLDEEVTYQEYLRPRDETKRKSGYRKILQACKQASRDGFEYIWIDTCCINQEDQDEVARNVKSMYAYYGNSDVCYAYLVDISTKTGISYLTQRLWRESDWFKRGWTLQELVAPQQVVFFDSSWTQIGDKEKLKEEIHDLTGIPSSVLEGSKPIMEVDIRERMSWCAGRQTTIPADLVYSLLGILGVQLEPDYKENVVNAFRRLQNALINAYPEAYKIFEDSGNIHRILISNNARVRLGIDTIDSGDAEYYSSHR
ncbi:hypothetical protein VKT23_018346 [Stygiomarasmius scandens]|uniref:Heterokaryon incompatibility domain-containing protein n=1 Tax=Marasmiellus scandens TaxID=2682957 RepID=A0ABR1ITW3_9AGAR